MVEFALVAPLFMALFVGLADVGRGLLAYTELAMGARAGGREAVLQYNASSNTASGCTSCHFVPGVVPIIKSQAGLGFAFVYSDSANQSTPPTYGTATADPGYAANGNTPPYDLSLSSSASSNTVYVFIYQYDPSATAAAARWSCGSSCSGTAARTSGHELVVVDLKLRWTSITLSLLGLSPSIVLDSQSVQRAEF